MPFLITILSIIIVGSLLTIIGTFRYRKRAAILRQQKVAFCQKCKDNSYNFETIIDDGHFLLLADEANGIWCSDYSGVVYDINSIRYFTPVVCSPRPNSKFCTGQLISVDVQTSEGCIKVNIGRNSNYYTKGSTDFLARKEKMRFILDELDRLMSKKFYKTLREQDFALDLSRSHLGQILCVDKQQKNFCIRTASCPQTILGFDSLLDYWAVRDGAIITKDNMRNPLVGCGLSGVPVGDGNYIALMCKELKIVLKLTGGKELSSDPQKDTVLIEYSLISHGQKERISSKKFKDKQEFADDLIIYLQYILTNK